MSIISAARSPGHRNTRYGRRSPDEAELRNASGGRLEHAQQMAARELPRTTKLYDRTKDEITIGEVERIQL